MNIFLAAPYTGKLDSATCLIEESYREWLDNVIQGLVRKGHIVTSAHLREKWGANLEPPETAIQNDFTSIKSCDLLVAYLGNPLSPGVQMELGFAVAFKKPLIVIYDKHVNPPYLVNGLKGLTQVATIVFDNGDDLLNELYETVEAIWKSG